MRLPESTGDPAGVTETLMITLNAHAIKTPKTRPNFERSQTLCKAQSLKSPKALKGLGYGFRP
jgi:hypothetical protein